jgi:hypothetical protein
MGGGTYGVNLSGAAPVRRFKKRDKRGNGSDEPRVKQCLAVFALESDDLATGATNVRVNVECFPEVVDRARARSRADVEEDTDARLENRTKGVKETSGES